MGITVERQFTATVYIIKDKRVLLVYHRKYGKWLPPGGHLLPNELPQEAALREAYEETGLVIALMEQENLTINRWNAKSLTRPYLCLLEEIPVFGDKPAHQHIDFIFIGFPTGGAEQHAEEEVESIKWFSLAEVEKLVPDVEIFAETQETIAHLFNKKLF